MYISDKKWNKGFTLLFPFICKSPDINIPDKVYILSLFKDEDIFSIADGNLSCLYSDKGKIPDLINSYSCITKIKHLPENKYIIIYDISNKKDLIDKVISGEYSKIEYQDKLEISKFWGNKITNKPYPPIENGIILDMILFPTKYISFVEKELKLKLPKNSELASRLIIEDETFNEL